MARKTAAAGRCSIRLARCAFSISETCYRYRAKLEHENAVIADWLVRLTHNYRNWGFGLCYLYLRNVYCDWNHWHLIGRHRLIAGMSGRWNCYGNAVVENFFHRLKIESIHGAPLMPADALRETLFETIEVEHNRTRRQSSLGYISSYAFEARVAA